MNYKDKKKLTTIDKQKIEARFINKLEEYKIRTLDELQEIYLRGSISNTDRQAMLVATDFLLKERAVEIAKERELTEVDGKEEGSKD